MKRRKHDGNGYMRSMEKCSPGDMVDDHGMNVMVETQANHSTDSNEVSVRNDDPQTMDRDEEDEGNLSDVSGVLESSPSPRPRPQSSTPRTSSVSESEPEPETEPEPTSKSKSKSKTTTKSTDSRVVPNAPITTSAHQHDDGLNGNPLKQSATLSSARCTKISVPNDERDGDEILPEDTLESRFTLQNKVYAGTYGEVWRATDNINGQTRALKFIKISHRTSRSGFPNTALREIDLLHRCRGKPHCNIIRMHGVVCSSKNLKKMAMVLEFAEHDLKTLLDLGIVYSQSEVKCLLKQLLSGLSYLHRRYIMHRDLKPNNLLLRSDGTLKICDFGQSRRFAEPLKGCMYSPQCTTLYYRAPEMLLDVREYGGSVDNWAVGCIAVELFLKKPVFKIDGRNQGPLDGETALLNMMISVLGSPFTVGGNEWSAFEGLFRKCQICRQGKVVRNLYTKNRGRVHHGGDQLHVLLRNTTLTSTGYGFIASLLTYDPRKRMTSAQGLEHEWFKQDPLPIDKDILPTHPPTNNETRDSVMKRNKEKRSKALGFMQF